jgi:PIN domain nuclease of toxin-antitoxin system
VNYLLDTCTLIWLINGGLDLSPGARQACSDPAAMLYVSAASAWEIAIKQGRGKLVLQHPIADWWKKALERHRLKELPISGATAISSVALPPIHSDPADRLLIATAQQHRLNFLTPDTTIAKYPDLIVTW